MQLWVVGCGLACMLAAPATGLGGEFVADVPDGTVLQETAGAATISSRLAASLLLVEVVRQALAAGALAPETAVAVVPQPNGSAKDLDVAQLTVDELLQLVLLTRSPTAAHSLAMVIGPGVPAARRRILATAARLGLSTATDTAEIGKPLLIDRALRISVRDLGCLGLRIARDPDLRRRLDLDGEPIADGRIIVRATDPLIATQPVLLATGRPPRQAALALARQGELELLAAATGPTARTDAQEVLARAFARYERRLVVRDGQPVGPLVHVRGGIIPRFTAVAGEAFAITVRRETPVRLTARLQLPTHVYAPIEVRQTVGELVLEENGDLMAVVPLVAPRAIAPRHWLGATTASD